MQNVTLPRSSLFPARTFVEDGYRVLTPSVTVDELGEHRTLIASSKDRLDTLYTLHERTQDDVRSLRTCNYVSLGLNVALGLAIVALIVRSRRLTA